MSKCMNKHIDRWQHTKDGEFKKEKGVKNQECCW